jgi:hypothetical protein
MISVIVVHVGTLKPVVAAADVMGLVPIVVAPVFFAVAAMGFCRMFPTRVQKPSRTRYTEKSVGSAVLM